MENSIVTITLAVLITLTSCSMAAPAGKKTQLPDISFLIESELAPKIINTTGEMTKTYPYIKDSSQTLQPAITLGLDTFQKKCSAMKQQEQLTEMYTQLAVFQTPLDLAYHSELNHPQLQQSIKEMRHRLKDAVQATEYLLHAMGISIPPVKTVNFAHMNSETKTYLTKLMKHQLTTLTRITPDEVKSYRNYVTVYTLHGATLNIRNCIPSSLDKA